MSEFMTTAEASKQNKNNDERRILLQNAGNTMNTFVVAQESKIIFWPEKRGKIDSVLCSSQPEGAGGKNTH